MPYVYAVTSGTAANFTTSGTPSTEAAFLQHKQATRGFDIQAVFLQGKGAGLTALSGITTKWKRWTTVGSGGTAVTPTPRRRDMPAAATTCAEGAFTPGTVSGVYQLIIGCGAAGPGGWVARDEDSKINVEGGSADEITGYSHSGTASLPFEAITEIVE